MAEGIGHWTQDKKGLGFNLYYMSYVEVSGNIIIPFCLCLQSSDGYLMDEKLCMNGSRCVCTCMMCVLYSFRGD